MDAQNLYKVSLTLITLTFLPFLSAPVVLTASTISKVSVVLIAFSLVPVTGMQVAKTNTTFCIFFLRIFDSVMPFSITIETFNLKNIFFIFLDGIGISINCKKAMVTTFLTPLTPKKFLVILVFLASLALMGKRLLVFATKYISRRSVSGLNSFGVFSVFFYGFVPLRILQINLSGP